MTSPPVVFLDKDGTLLEVAPFNADPTRMRFTPGAASALRLWHTHGYRVAVVANQYGHAVATHGETAFEAVETRLREMFEEVGVPLAGFHPSAHPSATSPGAIERAARAMGVSPRSCWLVGDTLDDVEAGSRAGATTVLLDVGIETEWRLTPWRIPDYLAHDLLEAAEVVLAVEEASLITRSRAERGIAPRASDDPMAPDGTAPSEW